MKWSCHTANIATVLGNAASLSDVTRWDRSTVKAGLGETKHPWITVACADATLLKGAEQLGGGYYERLLVWWSKMRPRVAMILADRHVTAANPERKHVCSHASLPPCNSFSFFSLSNTIMRKDTHSHTQTHTHTYLDPWSVNSAWVDSHCEHTWDGGWAEAPCVCLTFTSLNTHLVRTTRPHWEQSPVLMSQNLISEVLVKVNDMWVVVTVRHELITVRNL